jgi:ferredoxin
MKVSVDSDRCTGHARCWLVDPDLFQLDESGNSAIGEGLPVPIDKEALTDIAVQNCPEQALSIQQ